MSKFEVGEVFEYVAQGGKKLRVTVLGIKNEDSRIEEYLVRVEDMSNGKYVDRWSRTGALEYSWQRSSKLWKVLE